MGLFKRLSSRPRAERAFNQALDIFQTLCQYPIHSIQYHHALINAASYCQEAISMNNRHGDAYVLLSNVYVLIHIDIFSLSSNTFPLKLGAAVIQHWADEPMRQRPWTKNVDNGWRIYEIASTALKELNPEITNVENEMRTLKNRLHREAISEDSLSIIQEIMRDLR